ncbi:MAG: RNA polymerase sigma factor FliA [Proteobacteria bacterium]|nr:RNA polymerase sigma factor FliA [Pseudomonadota bacterium]
MKAANAYSAVQAHREGDELIVQHAGLVKRIAYHLAARLPSSVDVEDLVQAGMIGLLEAAASFAADRGATFETYAGIRIRGAMIDTLRQLDWTPRSVHRQSREAAAAMRAVEARTGREARDAETAAQMGLGINDFHRVMQDASSSQVGSIEDLPLNFDIADRESDPLRQALEAGFRDAMAKAIGDLPERERLVMSLYYDDEFNLKEIGLILKVSESRVCQIHGQALVRLKARLAAWAEQSRTDFIS